MSDLLNQASLVMVPSGYKEDTVYSVVPSDGSGDLAFTRASNGTRVNSAGLVEVCPWNFVEQSSNLSSWTTAGVTITTGITDAFGTTNAVTMGLISSGSNTDYIVKYSNAMALPTGTQINYSVYLKGSGTIGVIIERSVSGDYFYNQQAVTLSSTWTRYDFAYTIGVGVNANGISFYVSNLTGTTATSVDICFPQVNYGSTAKPYFPTTDRLNVPRLTYQNGGGGCPSLLLEKQSTNLVTYSEQFDNADWGKYQCSVSTNQTTSPDGTQNADKLTLSGNSGTYTGLVYRTTTPAANSIYMKNDSIGSGKFYIQVDGVGNAKWNSDGTLNSVSGGTATNGENMGNGWFRFAYVVTSGAYINCGIVDGTTGDSIFIWGAQVEAGSYPTSYIPTTSSSATRVADACSKTGISSLIGQTEGAFFIDVDLKSRLSYTYFLINNTTSNYIGVQFSTTNIQLEVLNAAVVQSIISLSNSATGRFKIAGAYANNDFVLYINGTQVGTDTSGSVPATNQVDLYYNATNTIQYNEVVFFKTRLTNAELASLTTL